MIPTADRPLHSTPTFFVRKMQGDLHRMLPGTGADCVPATHSAQLNFSKTNATKAVLCILTKLQKLMTYPANCDYQEISYTDDFMDQHKSAIVIGAGVGGVATAARLAKAGFNVTVIEKNSFTGDRCSLIHSAEYVREL